MQTQKSTETEGHVFGLPIRYITGLMIPTEGQTAVR